MFRNAFRNVGNFFGNLFMFLLAELMSFAAQDEKRAKRIAAEIEARDYEERVARAALDGTPEEE